MNVEKNIEERAFVDTKVRGI